MARKKENQDTEQDRAGILRGKQVEIGGIKITGDPGSRVVIGDSTMQATNVAGGPETGNVYVVADGQRLSPDMIRKAIEEQKLDAGQKDNLRQAVNEILGEIDQGPKADVALVNYMLKLVGEYSPAIARMLTDWMVNLPGAPKSLAR